MQRFFAPCFMPGIDSLETLIVAFPALQFCFEVKANSLIKPFE